MSSTNLLKKLRKRARPIQCNLKNAKFLKSNDQSCAQKTKLKLLKFIKKTFQLKIKKKLSIVERRRYTKSTGNT